jgi:hypothetical protein
MAVTAAGVASELDAFLRDVVPLLGNLTLPAGTGFFEQLRADIASELSGEPTLCLAVAEATSSSVKKPV